MNATKISVFLFQFYSYSRVPVVITFCDWSMNGALKTWSCNSFKSPSIFFSVSVVPNLHGYWSNFEHTFPHVLLPGLFEWAFILLFGRLLFKYPVCVTFPHTFSSPHKSFPLESFPFQLWPHTQLKFFTS